MSAPYPEEVSDRFWSKVDNATSPEGCWPWTGTLNREGRGRFTFDGETTYAYRWALRLTGTPVARGEGVRHLCGNPACCRPSHLAVGGGQGENALDTVEHGRHRQAKLDSKRVRRLRERYAEDRRPLREYARELGVSESTVSAAVRGETWPRAGGPLKRSRKRTNARGRLEG